MTADVDAFSGAPSPEAPWRDRIEARLRRLEWALFGIVAELTAVLFKVFF